MCSASLAFGILKCLMSHGHIKLKKSGSSKLCYEPTGKNNVLFDVPYST